MIVCLSAAVLLSAGSLSSLPSSGAAGCPAGVYRPFDSSAEVDFDILKVTSVEKMFGNGSAQLKASGTSFFIVKAMRPSSLSFFGRVGFAHTRMTVGMSDAQRRFLDVVFFRGRFALTQRLEPVRTSERRYTPGVWYRVEVALDWTHRRATLRVDGEVVQTLDLVELGDVTTFSIGSEGCTSCFVDELRLSCPGGPSAPVWPGVPATTCTQGVRYPFDSSAELGAHRGVLKVTKNSDRGSVVRFRRTDFVSRFNFFRAFRPSSLSFHGRVGSLSGSSMAVRLGDTGGRELTAWFFGGRFALTQGSGPVGQTFGSYWVNTWYRIDVTLDWIRRTATMAVNGGGQQFTSARVSLGQFSNVASFSLESRGCTGCFVDDVRLPCPNTFSFAPVPSCTREVHYSFDTSREVSGSSLLSQSTFVKQQGAGSVHFSKTNAEAWYSVRTTRPQFLSFFGRVGDDGSRMAVTLGDRQERRLIVWFVGRGVALTHGTESMLIPRAEPSRVFGNYATNVWHRVDVALDWTHRTATLSVDGIFQQNSGIGGLGDVTTLSLGSVRCSWCFIDEVRLSCN